MSKLRQQGLLVLILGPTAALVLRLMPLHDDREHSMCLFRRVTGLPCATCGMTRSLACLARGEWRRAYAYHPFGLPVAAALLTGWVGATWFWLRGRAVPSTLARVWFLACLCIAAGCFVLWIVSVVFPLAAAFWYH